MKNKSLIIIGNVLKILLCFTVVVFTLWVLFKSEKGKNLFSTPKTTLILGTENRLKLARGWNDIIILVTEHRGKVQITSFPRDTLVFIPPKGYWTINSLYLVLGAEGTVNWFNHRFKNLHIDNYVIIDMDKIGAIFKELEVLPLPGALSKMIDDFEYAHDWVRHRSKLKYQDYSRQMRVHTYLDKVVGKIKNFHVNKIVEWALVSIFQKNTKTSLLSQDIVRLIHSFKDKPIEYCLWEGTYRKVYFRLSKGNGYVFQEGDKQAYVLGTDDYNEIKPYKNPYIYSTQDFFAKKDIDIKFNIMVAEKDYYKKCTTWNGGLTLQKNKLISDYAFTNQKFTLEQVYAFFKLYPKNKLTKDERKLIFTTCRKYKINFLAVAATIEKEASLIRNRTSFDYDLRHRRVMGFGCYIKKIVNGVEVRPFEGYNTQIEKGIKGLRRHFDRYKEGIEVSVLSYEKTIKPRNASTYALYLYTPFYGEAVAFGHKTVGNRRFMSLWYTLNRDWRKING